MDVEFIIKSVSKTGCAVVAEEHQKNGGLGDAIAQVLANQPAPLEIVAVNDSFGESGKRTIIGKIWPQPFRHCQRNFKSSQQKEVILVSTLKYKPQ